MLLFRWLRSLRSSPQQNSRHKTLTVKARSSIRFAPRQSAVLISFSERQHSLSIYPIVRTSQRGTSF